jgi:hypothetical protein
LLVAAVGCGDNDHLCGVGTTYEAAKNACVPVSGCGPGTMLDPATNACVAVCTDGTKLNMTTGQCEVDPNDCQEGTVLIDGKCVDPTSTLSIDLDEGATEPNGFGVIEASPAPAGTIVLKPVGSAFVIHGLIKPFQDVDQDGQLDPDADTYTLTVTAPTLLEITADGVSGVDGGFVAIANAPAGDPIAGWFRFGLNITGDTSKRQVFLPEAATYYLTIADTRTLFQYSTGGPINAAPGPGEYYITIKQLAMPTPNALTASATGATMGEVAFYSTSMGTGINDVTLDMPAVETASALVALQNSAFRKHVFAFNPNTQAVQPGGTSTMLVGGFDTSDDVVLVVDDLWNYATAPASYTLTARTSNATPLSTNGGTATITEQQFTDPLSLPQFYFDVAAADQTLGMNLVWNRAVQGSLYNGNLDLVARFTNIGGAATWTSYTGLLRVPTAGRYYFFVYDPTGTPGTTQLTATSRIDQLALAAIVEGTSTGTVSVDANYKSNALAYSAGADPWQTFDSTGTNTGGQVVSWFDPKTVFGRLDSLTTSGGPSAGNNAGAALQPIFTHSYTTTGGAFGRILLDDPTTTYFVKVNAAAPAASPTFTLTFAARTISDLGMVAANNTPVGVTGQTIDTTNTPGYYLFHTDNGNVPTVTVHPHTVALLNTDFQRVKNDESGLGPLVNNAGGDDVETYVQIGNGWTAFVVQAVTPPASAQLYDVSVSAAPSVAYSETVASQTYTSVCGTTGASPIVFVADGITVAATDDGLASSVVATPAGFDFYGVPTTAFRVSTNGWLSFDTGQANSAPGNQNIPDPTAPNNVVAPYWTNLHNVTACTKPVGTTIVVQWDAVDASGAAVHTQAILDGSNSAITFLWSSAQAALGDKTTIGIEDPAGANAKVHSYNTAGSITAGSGKTYTPM